jgi:hypothetical protein
MLLTPLITELHGWTENKVHDCHEMSVQTKPTVICFFEPLRATPMKTTLKLHSVTSGCWGLNGYWLHYVPDFLQLTKLIPIMIQAHHSDHTYVESAQLILANVFNKRWVGKFERQHSLNWRTFDLAVLDTRMFFHFRHLKHWVHSLEPRTKVGVRWSSSPSPPHQNSRWAISAG